MIFEVRHRTHYRYQSTAVFSQHLMRLTPRDAPGQKVLDSRIVIRPRPDSEDTQTDMFGNLAHVATVTRPHGMLEIEAVSRVERQPPSSLIFEASSPWEQVRDRVLGRSPSLPVPAASPFVVPSEMTRADAEIAAWGAESLTPDRPVLAVALELSGRIYREFDYIPGATDAGTLPVESFAARRGVCQDFAHVMLAALRAHGLPARYVSGYLRTLPPPGQERLQGSDASHAWVSVWDPAFGWVDFDPTNDMVPGDDHITLAWARDFADVSPVAGIVVGAGQQILSVGVDVVPLSHDEPEAAAP